MDGLLPILIIFGIISLIKNYSKKAEAERRRAAQQAQATQAAQGGQQRPVVMQQQTRPPVAQNDPWATFGGPVIAKAPDPRFEGWEAAPRQKQQSPQKKPQPNAMPAHKKQEAEQYKKTPLTSTLVDNTREAEARRNVIEASSVKGKVQVGQNADGRREGIIAPMQQKAKNPYEAASNAVVAMAGNGANANMLVQGIVLSEILGKPVSRRQGRRGA